MTHIKLNDSLNIYYLLLYIMSHKVSLNKYKKLLHNKTRSHEKIKFGEVMTPLYVIICMISMIPIKVWTNKNLKILDPASGDGRFSLYCYEMLMKKLKSIKNKTDRSNHIIQNMLYMCEINKQNVNKIISIFDSINSNIKPNIYDVDFLKWDTDIKFDIIVGNVPYNKSGGVGRVKGGSKQPIWHRFIEKSLNILNNKGYINFIHPVGWRKYYDKDENDNIGHVLYNYNQQGSILSLKMNNIKYGDSWPIVDYYLYQKDVNKSSKIESIYNNKKYKSIVDLHTNKFIPSIYTLDVNNIINKLFINRKSDKLNIIYHGWMQPNKKMMGKSKNKNDISYAFYYDTKLNKYHVIYENTKSKITKSKSIKNKKRKIERLETSIKSPKIIMTFHGSKKIGHLHPQYFKEPIGTTTYTMYMDIKPSYNTTMLVNFLNSKLIIFLLILTQYSPPPRNKNEWKILNNIHIPIGLNTHATDDSIYKYYNLTKNEVQLIEEVINNAFIKRRKRTQKK